MGFRHSQTLESFMDLPLLLSVSRMSFYFPLVMACTGRCGPQMKPLFKISHIVSEIFRIILWKTH